MKHFTHLFFIISFFISTTAVFGQCIEITAETEELYCPGEEITLTATSGFENYSWYYNFSNSNEGGQLLMESGSDNFITISASEWAVAYIYVEVDDANCTEPSPTVVWDSWVFGNIAISHEFNTIICPGDSSLIENAFNGPVNFQWYKDFEPIDGATTSSYWVTEPGTYTLQASYPQCPDFWLNSGIGPTFEFYNVQIPVINFEMVDDEPRLFITTGVDVQWYLDGEAIEGADSPIHIPTESGIYTVSAIDQNGCTVISAGYNYNVVSSNDTIQKVKFEVFPNPFQAEINIVSDINHTNGFIRIFDLTGKQVGSQRIMNNATQTTMNLNDLNKGIYLLEMIFDNGDKEVIKLIKSN